MTTVQHIIDLFGGLEVLKDRPIRLVVTGFMPLTIEYVGEGPRGWPLVSVAHYYEQNGDLMADPDMTFEVQEGRWHPVEFQQANPPRANASNLLLFGYAHQDFPQKIGVHGRAFAFAGDAFFERMTLE